MAKIQECQCGARYNVDKFKPGSKFKCKKCGAIMTVGEPPTPKPEQPPVPEPVDERASRRPRRPRKGDDAPHGREDEGSRSRRVRPDKPGAPSRRRPDAADGPPRRKPSRPAPERGADTTSRRRPRRPRSADAPVPPPAEEESPRRRPRRTEDRPEPRRRPGRPTRDEAPTPPPAEEAPPRRRKPSKRVRKVEDESAKRPRRAAPAPPPPEPEEPEKKPQKLTGEVFVKKEDYAAKRKEVMSKAPKLVGVPLIVNVVAFIAVLVGGIMFLNSLAAPPKSGADDIISKYERQSTKITSTLKEKLELARSLGVVDERTVFEGVKGRYSAAAKRALKSTVTVISDIDVFQGGRPRRVEYYGSGFIFKPDGDRTVDGYVMTCYENIAGSRSVRVMLSDHSLYNARVIGLDVPSNLAVLQLNRGQMAERNPELVALEWADSDKAKKNVAQFVLAIGSPLAFPNSVSMGIISCPDRYASYQLRSGQMSGKYNQFFQTDSQINWGSSGGPLVDLDGRVCGVAVTTEGIYRAFNLRDYNGLFFAIHSNFARSIGNEIKKYGKVERAYTGIMVDSLKSLELDISFKGVAIVGIEPDSPAEEAGLVPGDILTKVSYTEGGEEKTIALDARYNPDLATIYDKLSRLPLNTEVSFSVMDIFENKKPAIKLTTSRMPKDSSKVFTAKKWGIVVSPMSKRDAKAFNMQEAKGVKVIAVISGSPASNAGLYSGCIILEVDGKPVDSVASFESKYKNLESARAKNVKLKIHRASGAFGTLSPEIMRLLVKYD